MKSEEKALKMSKKKSTNSPNYQPTIVSLNKAIPFNISTDLAQYNRLFLSKEYDPFKIVHCYENWLPDYRIYGELPDGDKRLLFTCSQHFECKCCDCFELCMIPMGCCAYMCCDSIIFQMDYRKNGAPFFAQGLYIHKGFYCCKCYCCQICSCLSQPDILELKETTDPNNPDINSGVQKGKTEADIACCSTDHYAKYSNQGLNGPVVKAKCCEICKHCCLKCCCGLDWDFNMVIEDGAGKECGNIMIYSGCYSEKSGGRFCYLPRKYYEINLPSNASSEQKFQIVADLVHFDLINRLL